MEGIGMTSFLACFLFVSLHTFYQNTHAQNHTTPSFSTSSPNRRTLRIGVPQRTTFTEFVSVEKNGTNFVFGGFCVEVFKAAITTLNYSVDYIPIQIRETSNNMVLNDYIIRLVVLKKLDAVVADLTITSNRSKEVQFTQPFFDSGLVVVVPLKNLDVVSFGWVFAKPFTVEMWLLTVGFLISGGMVVYILERKNNRRFHGQRSEQFRSILWFSFSTWLNNQDDIRSVMGRIVIVAWLFVFGILQSCYTANLSAILTATRLEPTLHDIKSVAASNVRIGYHVGSLIGDLLPEYYGISKHRLVSLSRAGYYDALTRGHVGAIVDGRPYMQSLVAKHCSHLAIAGQTFIALNWGFAFDRMDYQLVRDVSDRILELSENGELHRLRKQWMPYYDRDCSQYSDESGTSPLQVQHFWGLFVISGLVSTIVLLFYAVQRKWKSSKVVSPTPPPSEGSCGPTLLHEDSSGYGGGGFIPGEYYGGRLKLMKKIQCSSGPTLPPEDSSCYGGGGFNPRGLDHGGSLELTKKIQCSSGATPPPEYSSGYGRGGFIPGEDHGREYLSGYGRGGFIPGEDYGERLTLMKKIQFLRRTKSLNAKAMPFVGI